MAVSVSCNSCEYQFMVEGQHQGKRIRCPSCGDPLLVGGVSSEPKDRRRTRGDVRRERLAREKSIQTSRTLMAAGIAFTLIVMGVVGLVMMMQPDPSDSDVVNPAGDETLESPQQSSETSPGSEDGDSGALMPATRRDAAPVLFVIPGKDPVSRPAWWC